MFLGKMVITNFYKLASLKLVILLRIVTLANLGENIVNV